MSSAVGQGALLLLSLAGSSQHLQELQAPCPQSRCHCHLSSLHCPRFKVSFVLETEQNSPCGTTARPREQLAASRDLENTRRFFTLPFGSANSIILILKTKPSHICSTQAPPVWHGVIHLSLPQPQNRSQVLGRQELWGFLTPLLPRQQAAVKALSSLWSKGCSRGHSHAHLHPKGNLPTPPCAAGLLLTFPHKGLTTTEESRKQ